MDGSNSLIGLASYRDISPSALSHGAVRYSSTTQASLLRSLIEGTFMSYGATSASVPFAWAAGDVIWAEGAYEAT